MKQILLAVATFAALASARGQVVNDPDVLEKLKPGVASTTDVTKAFGTPRHIDKNPDGRFVHLYPFVLASKSEKGKVIKGTITFLFDANSKLIQHLLLQEP